jgi:rSAM/selenodomain-associated transferase 1
LRTLIVFAREPRPGRVKTRLAASLGAEASCRLYQAFVRDLCRVLSSQNGLSVEWWLEGEPGADGSSIRPLVGEDAPIHFQPEGDLGRKMRDAFADAFSRGGRPVAIVGTDCPLLGPTHLESLFSALEPGFDAALLPVEDGGYVGLALTRFAPEPFEGIPWSTGRVLEATLAALRSAGRRVRVLPRLYDVDTASDLERLTRDLRADPARAPETARVLLALSGAASDS